MNFNSTSFSFQSPNQRFQTYQIVKKYIIQVDLDCRCWKTGDPLFYLIIIFTTFIMMIIKDLEDNKHRRVFKSMSASECF